VRERFTTAQPEGLQVDRAAGVTVAPAEECPGLRVEAMNPMTTTTAMAVTATAAITRVRFLRLDERWLSLIALEGRDRQQQGEYHRSDLIEF
jgi:hypothetical protein